MSTPISIEWEKCLAEIAVGFLLQKNSTPELNTGKITIPKDIWEKIRPVKIEVDEQGNIVITPRF